MRTHTTPGYIRFVALIGAVSSAVILGTFLNAAPEPKALAVLAIILIVCAVVVLD